MGDSIPYLGSKITLISKSEIRYEGILYTIDPHDSIIALARVQSFGTEDRQTDMPIAAKNDIYEYIIFRGTDIKKIEVCDTPKQLPVLHNDPAIVGLQVQQHSAPSVPTSYPGASFNPQSLGPIGSFYSSYGQQLGQQNLPSSGFSVGTSQPSELSSGIGSSVGVVSVEQPSPSGGSQPLPAPIGAPSHSGVSSHSHQQDVLAGGSRSSTPGLSRKSPVADAGVQVSPPPQQQNDKRRSNQSNQRPQHTPERQIREHQGNQARRGHGNYYQQGQNQYQSSRNNQGYQGHQGGYQGHQGHQGHQGYQEHRGYYQGQQQQQQYQGGQYRGGMGRSRPARRPSQPRGRGIFNQGNRQRQDQQLFEKEFDFEQANEEFEELRTQLAKTKITENGEKKDEKKEDSGHETATTGDDSEDSSSSVYYDKTSSFFDSISCEALERSKGRSQRSDWRQERKINIQTFGVATARRGYYPRGARGGYYNRGGYYRNYNQGYYRGNNNSNYRGYRGGMGGGNSNHLSSSNNSNRMTTVNGSVGAGDTGGAINSSSSSSTYASAVRSTTAVAK